MGHGSSDKMYISAAEYSGAFGEGHSSNSGARAKKSGAAFQRLPYNCCALTLKPVETPVVTSNGELFELLSIIPWIKEHGTNPVTGKPMVPGDLISVNFAFNSDGVEHDPITYKIFTEHTPIVIIKSTGNVFSKETIDRLNIKPNHWQDLMNDVPFTRSDIITLQDPYNVSASNYNEFDHIKRDIKLGSTSSTAKPIPTSSTSSSSTPSTSATASTSKLPTPTILKLKSTTSSLPYNSSSLSSNRTAASFTSTSAPKQTITENAMLDEEDVMFKAVMKKGEKGFVRLVTNFGNLNLELHCDKAPRTTYNFLQLAKENKYNDTIFHRLIPGFMLQGGDPTGTGRGGKSCWGEPFEDEFEVRGAYKHEERGTLSSANSGPNSNSSQFFLTFRPTPHLDGKHTVFGRLVGGEEVLSKLESLAVDPLTDRPLKKIILKQITIFGDPFEGYKKKLGEKLSKELKDRDGMGERERKREERDRDRTTWFGTNLSKPPATSTSSLLDSVTSNKSSSSSGIGKYLAPPSNSNSSASGSSNVVGSVGSGSGSVVGGMVNKLKRKDSELAAGGANKKVKAKREAFADW